MKFKKELLSKISCFYDHLITEYGSEIDTNKRSKSIGGTYYGSTQLYSTQSAMFEKEEGFVNHGYGGSRTAYDFAIKVGGLNYDEFRGICHDLYAEFVNGIEDILFEYGFVLMENREGFRNFGIKEGNERYSIFLNNKVTHGTNFSVHCGFKLTKV
ncbi:gp612 [Bacillus phage G]|uniref:Gp612 n=1 Tax=Bacillus phage G TaxID=2884420 RepID=G3MAZ2_9CAUD|nr:gp612 [Bacillus phage G]AEO93857.1 gp612 [Bacillus phage G]